MGMTRKFFLVISLSTLALTTPRVEVTAATPQLQPHRAVYTMAFGTARSGSGTADARGVMYLEWAEGCDGWTSSQRVKLMLYPTQGGELDTDSNFSSWESRDGGSYRFTVRNMRNGQVTEELRGDAKLEGPDRSGRAVFATPPGLSFALPKGALFPTEHMARLIVAAQAGENRFSRVIFDGGNIAGPMEANAIIGATARPPAKVLEELKSLASWPVRLAFFPINSQQAEPEQEMAIRLYENGVADHFLIDYGDFTVTAVLAKMEPLDRPKCE